MDPFTFVALCVLAFGAVGGFDAASGGLVRAEIGGGVRGATGHVVRAEQARWGRARTKAREIRTATPEGRAVQKFLDTSGVLVRAFGAELAGLGSGVVRGWRSGRVRAKAARQERMAGQPWPIVRTCGPLLDRAKARVRSGAGSGVADPNEAEPIDPNGASSEPAADPNTREANPNLGCIQVVGWAVEEGQRWPRFCGEPREAEWVLCPEHLATVRVDPTYPTEDIDEYRADPNHLGPDAYRPNPNGDSNVTDSPVYGTKATGDRDPHIFDCGCCGLIHEPLAAGAHCPNCHLHDLTPNPNQPAPTGTRGPSMPDITSAPAAIAAWEQYRGRYEEIESLAADLQSRHEQLGNLVDALHGEVASTADGMGDFAIGGEGDVASLLDTLRGTAASAREQAGILPGSVSSSKEQTDAYLSALHLEYDASIEAAESKQAAAHSAMQEV